MMYLKANTAATIKFGPFLDYSASSTSPTIANTDVRLSKNGGNFAQKAASGNIDHDEEGYYDTTLSAGHVDTVGRLIVACRMDNVMPVRHEYMVVDEEWYDAMVGSRLLPVDVETLTSSIIANTNFAGNGVNVKSFDAAAFDVTLTETYSAQGTDGTLKEMLWLIQQAIMDFTIGGTTLTIFKKDGSTTAATVTLDDGTNPTSRKRAT